MSKAKTTDIKKRALTIVWRLTKLYPDAKCELSHENPWQLLVATILSAQCTDKRVNLVTPNLFAQLPTPEDFAAVPIADLEELIRTTGFFRNKARNIQKAAHMVLDKHGGKVPRTMEELIELSGVGRKTANVILGNAYDIPGMVVDTHVMRLSARLGLTRQKDPHKIEIDLMELIPKKNWTVFSHYLILHGRRVCFARKPQCQKCELNDICPSAFRA